MTDPVNHPAHYTKGAIEIIDVVETVVIGYDPVIAASICHVAEYIARAPHKGNMLQDLEKARWYLDRAIGHAGRIKDGTGVTIAGSDDPRWYPTGER